MVLPGELGFGLLPRQGVRSLGLALIAGLGFGLWMALADASLFASAIPEVQRLMTAQMTASERIVWFARGALVDEVIYRLIAMTAIAWCLALVSRLREGRLVWPVILLVALVVYPNGNWAYFSALEPSVLTVLRALSLHGAAGVLWGWLYWRHGWLSAVTGHVAAHLSLQPLLSLLASA